MVDFRLVKYRGRYAVAWQGAEGIERRSLRTDDLELAEQRLADFKRQATRPVDTNIRNMMNAYLTDRPSDTATYSWLALEPFWGPLRADQITTDLCREYAETRRTAGRADGTIIRELGVLKAAVKRYASDAGAAFEVPPPPPARDRHLTRGEYRRLLAGAREPHIRLFVMLALATAGRAGAVLGITWAQVDFQRELINLGVGTKHKGRAIVPMTKGLKVALRAAYQQRSTTHVVEFRGRPVKSIRKGFENAAVRAELDDVTPHVLRHTAAVWMAEAGVSMAEIAQFLGHSSEQVTFKIYARFSPDFLRRAVSALDVE